MDHLSLNISDSNSGQIVLAFIKINKQAWEKIEVVRYTIVYQIVLVNHWIIL